MKKSVSVVVPVFNASRWAESIAISIETNIVPIGQLILVNDGEEEDFVKLVKYIRAFLSIPINCFTTNGKEGPAIARNIGINQSLLEYIAFLDCDDQWLPRSLEKRLNLLNRVGEAPFVYSSYYRTSLNGQVTNITRVPPEAGMAKLLVTNFIATPSVVVRRTALMDIRFRPVGHEDYDFWLRLIGVSGASAVGLMEPVVNVRTVDGSLSAVKKHAARWHYKILKENAIPLHIRLLLFLGYLINGILKRKIYDYKPLFFGLDLIMKWWIPRFKDKNIKSRG